MSRLGHALGTNFPPGSTVTRAMLKDTHDTQRLNGYRGEGGKLPAGWGGLEPGHRVVYAGHWLRATQAHHLAFARGTVTGRTELTVDVEWDGGLESNQPHHQRVLATNLVRVDRMPLEPV